jgi:predicted RecA/RadA family phage recombinase
VPDEAKNIGDAGLSRYQADGTVTPYEVRQGPTGEAEVFDTANAASATSYPVFRTRGRYTIQKTNGIAILKGGRVYWDHSANTATYRKQSDRDFYLGRATEDAAETGPTVAVDLNLDPPYDLDLLRDPCDVITTGTQVLGAFLPPRLKGGALHFLLSATNEAQILSLITVDGFAEEANAIIEGAFRVISDGAGTVVDVSMGIANAAHATDMDSATEAVLIHLNANSTIIYAESRDGVSAAVTATDTTKTYTEGAGFAVRKEFWLDMRNPADVQVYVDAVNVLPSSVFDVDGGTGPWKLICHVEKTASTDTYELALDWLRARFSEQ